MKKFYTNLRRLKEYKRVQIIAMLENNNAKIYALKHILLIGPENKTSPYKIKWNTNA